MYHIASSLTATKAVIEFEPGKITIEGMTVILPPNHAFVHVTEGELGFMGEVRNNSIWAGGVPRWYQLRRLWQFLRFLGVR